VSFGAQGSLGLSFNERINHGNESPLTSRGKMEVLVHFVEVRVLRREFDAVSL
jgi:hypothetical protein